MTIAANILTMPIVYYIFGGIALLLDKLSKIEIGYIEVENPNIIYVIIYYVLIFSYMIYKEIKTMKEQENEIQGYCL